MDRYTFGTLAIVITLILGFSAEGQVRNQDWSELNPDDWTVVADGNNATIADGMYACTASKYCIQCDSTPEGVNVCTMQYRNAYCKCTFRIDPDGKRRCSSNGACTYTPR